MPQDSAGEAQLAKEYAPKARLTDQDPDEQIRAHLEEQAHQLVSAAKAFGFVITITHEPQQPLAMGNFKHVVDTRPARKRAS